MNDLSMTDGKIGKLSKLEDRAIDVVQEALDDQRDVDESAKIAIKTLGIVAKNRQTLTHRQAIEFSMAATIGTEQELKKYIKSTSPQIVKALTGKIDGK